MKNKRGQVHLLDLLEFAGLALLVILMFASLLYAVGIFSDSIIDADIVTNTGVNISNYSHLTIGQVNEAFLNTADLIGVLFLLGMILALFIGAWITREEGLGIFFMVDFIILLFSYFLAVYVSNNYGTILPLLPFTDLIASNMANTSRVMFVLPMLTAVIGFLMMVVAYAGIPRTREEEVGGF